MTTIDSFYEVVSQAIEPEIQDLLGPRELPAHWIVILDEEGVAVTRSDAVGGQVLAALIDSGAHGAAFVSLASDSREVVVADVLVAMPRNSDVRRAYVKRTDPRAVLGPWEHIV